jgi:glycerophosphoryl diester phosphodiesterase
MGSESRRAFLDARGLIAFAHRGGAEDAPENTLEAFRAAVALGYTYVETDVHATADGHVVAFHDRRLGRVTDIDGDIGAMPLHRVREADAGHWFTSDGGRSFPFRGRGIRVPTLTELLEELPAARINIDAKDDRCVEPLLEVLRRHDAYDRVCLASFSDRRLAGLRALSRGRVCTSMGRNAVALFFVQSRGRRRGPRFNADCVQVPLRWRALGIVDRRFIDVAHASHLPVHVWTVDDPVAMNAVIELGVDGIMTDRPRQLRDVLQRRGTWPAPHNPGTE